MITLQEFFLIPEAWLKFQPTIAIFGNNPSWTGELLPAIALRETAENIANIEASGIQLRYGCFKIRDVTLAYLAMEVVNSSNGAMQCRSEMLFDYHNRDGKELFKWLAKGFPILVMLYDKPPLCQRAVMVKAPEGGSQLPEFFAKLREELQTSDGWTDEEFLQAKADFEQQFDLMEIWHMLPAQMQHFAQTGQVRVVVLGPPSGSARRRQMDFLQSNCGPLVQRAVKGFQKEGRGYLLVEPFPSGIQICYRALGQLDESEAEDLGDALHLLSDYNPEKETIVMFTEAGSLSTYRIQNPSPV
jgi:hypothetical protein